MSDLINRQAVIEAIERDAYRHTYLDQIIDIIKSMPSAQPEPLTVNFAREMDRETIEKLKEGLKNAPVLLMAVNDSARPEPHWIPCSERLPEVCGRYLVTRGLNACGALWNRVYIINYSDLMGLKSERIWWDGNVGKSDFERIDDVIAWMPLPEPYKGEQE